jgi:DNA mismatch endonuclease (patch repair protein)
MADIISPQARSALMAKVRSAGNKSTEKRVEAALRKAGVKGWKKHPKNIAGRPDFYFSKAKLVVFVDGCFWHSCPRCGRLPASNVSYWITKIDSNRRRDNRIQRQLRRRGFHVIRVWEHEVRRVSWLHRVERMLERYGRG